MQSHRWTGWGQGRSRSHSKARKHGVLYGRLHLKAAQVVAAATSEAPSRNGAKPVLDSKRKATDAFLAQRIREVFGISKTTHRCVKVNQELLLSCCFAVVRGVFQDDDLLG